MEVLNYVNLKPFTFFQLLQQQSARGRHLWRQAPYGGSAVIIWTYLFKFVIGEHMLTCVYTEQMSAGRLVRSRAISIRAWIDWEYKILVFPTIGHKVYERFISIFREQFEKVLLI